MANPPPINAQPSLAGRFATGVWNVGSWVAPKVIPTAKWVWNKTPWPVKVAAQGAVTYATPVGTTLKLASCAHMAWQMASDQQKQAVRNEVVRNLQQTAANVPPPEDLAEEWALVKQKPMQAIPLIKRAWDATPEPVQLAAQAVATYALPLGLPLQLASAAHMGWKMLPENRKQPIREEVARKVEQAQQQYPLVAQVSEVVGQAAEQVGDLVQHAQDQQMVVAGRNYNSFARSAGAEDPQKHLDEVRSAALDVLKQTSGTEPAPVPPSPVRPQLANPAAAAMIPGAVAPLPAGMPPLPAAPLAAPAGAPAPGAALGGAPALGLGAALAAGAAAAPPGAMPAGAPAPGAALGGAPALGLGAALAAGAAAAPPGAMPAGAPAPGAALGGAPALGLGAALAAGAAAAPPGAMPAGAPAPGAALAGAPALGLGAALAAGAAAAPPGAMPAGALALGAAPAPVIVNPIQPQAVAPAVILPALPIEVLLPVAAPEAIGLHEQAPNVEGPKEADKCIEDLNPLVEKFAVIGSLCKVCNMSEQKNIPPGPSNFELARMAATPDANGKKPDLWNLFIQRYPIRRFSIAWFKCKLTYWLSYKWTSIIPNLASTYLKHALGQAREMVTDKVDGEKRTELNQGVLQKSDKVLSAIIDAKRQYATATPREGTLHDYIRRAVVSQYGYSLEQIKNDQALRKTLAKHDPKLSWIERRSVKPEQYTLEQLEKLGEDYALEKLCAEFSKKLMKESPHIHFFKQSKKKGFLGQVCYALEWLPNKIAAFFMKRSILPSVLKNAVEGSLEAAKPENLPVTISMLEFCTSLFHTFHEKLKARKGDSSPIAKLPGTKDLPKVVRELIQAIQLAPLEEPQDIKNKLAEFDNPGAIDGRLLQGIEDGTQQGVLFAIDFFTNPANHEELFADLFKNLGKLFSSSEPKTTAQLKTAQDNLKQEALLVFRKLVNDSVRERIKLETPEAANRLAVTSFTGQKEDISRLFAPQVGDDLATRGQAQVLLEQIGAKVTADSPTPENSIHPELHTLANMMLPLAEHARVQNEHTGLTPASKEAIRYALGPIYANADHFAQELRTLGNMQAHFSAHQSIMEEFDHLQRLLGEMSTKVDRDTLNLDVTLPQLLSSVNKIGRQLSRNYPNVSAQDEPKVHRFITELREMIEAPNVPSPNPNERSAYAKSLTYLSKSIIFNHKVLGELAKLDLSSAVPDPLNQNKGLLRELANFERYNRNPQELRRVLPHGFKKDLWLEKINQSIAILEEDEQNRLRALIKKITDFGQNPVGVDFQTTIWDPLKVEMEAISDKYKARRTEQKVAFKDSWDVFKRWNVEKRAQFDQRKKDNHDAMVHSIDEARRLANEIGRVAVDARTTLLNSVDVTPQQLGAVAGAVGGLIGGLVSGPLGVALGTAAYVGVNNIRGLTSQNGTEAQIKTGGAALGAAAAAHLLGLGPLVNVPAAALPAGIAAANAVEQTVESLTANVTEKVMQLFASGYDFILSGPVLQAIATQGMLSWVNTKPAPAAKSIFAEPLSAAAS